MQMPFEVCPEHGVALKPWEDGPRQLVSWWDVQKFSAMEFIVITSNLATEAQRLASSSHVMSRSDIITLGKNFERCVYECRQIGLGVSASQFRSAADTLNFENQFKSEIAAMMIQGLLTAVMAEMQGHLFFWIQSDRAQYYEKPQPFGDDVARQFPSLLQDIRAASNCYATDNYTASVFHCMRVLEVGLHALADHLSVSFSVPVELQNWQNIIEPVEKEILHREKSLPKGMAKSEELQFLSEAAAQFRYFKEAWRNHVAHARLTFDDVQALQIMNHVKQFMQVLAQKGLHD